jgi:hypothetical protein
LTDNPLVPRFARRSPVALLALVCALMCLSLVASGSAIAAGSGGGGNGNGNGSAKAGSSNGGGGSSSGGGGNSSAAGGGSSSGGQGVNPLSGSGPLSPGLSTPGTPTPTTATQTQPSTVAQTTTTSASGGGSFNQTAVLGIVIGAVVVIGGVCWYIFRDAGRRTRRHGRAADAPRSTQPSVPGSKRVKPRKLSPQERKRRKRGRAPRRK